MILPLASAGGSALWYLTRGAGAVSLVMLSASVVLGLLGVLRVSAGPLWPRVSLELLHRDLSLMVLVFLAVHIVTAVVDGFAPIALLDVVVPFLSRYRPLWLGLGAVAFDLLMALVVTSLLRRRLGLRTWRLLHWLAYACWPLAMLHGLGAGSDTHQGWMLALTLACSAAVLAALGVRVHRSRPEPVAVRRGAWGALVLVPVGTAVFALEGPLQPGWARRAGTPPTLLASSAGRATRPAGPADHAFTSRISGRLGQRAEPGGEVVQLTFRLQDGSVPVTVRVRLAGTPDPGGGLSLSGSQVDLVAPGLRSALRGQVSELNNQKLVARLRGDGGRVEELHADLQLDTSNHSVSGTASLVPLRSHSR